MSWYLHCDVIIRKFQKPLNQRPFSTSDVNLMENSHAKRCLANDSFAAAYFPTLCLKLRCVARRSFSKAPGEHCRAPAECKKERDVQVDDSLGGAKSVLAARMHVASNDFGDGGGSERWAQKFAKLFLYPSRRRVYVVAAQDELSRSCIIAAGTFLAAYMDASALDSKKRFTSMSMSQY